MSTSIHILDTNLSGKTQQINFPSQVGNTSFAMARMPATTAAALVASAPAAARGRLVVPWHTAV